MKTKNINISGASSSAFFDRLYKLLAILAVTAAATPIGAIFTTIYGMPLIINLMIPAVAITVGYLLQSIAAFIMRYKRIGKVSRNYEQSDKYVYGAVMIPSGIASFIVSIFIYNGVFSYLRMLAEHDRNYLFDASSLTPLLFAAVTFIFMMLGGFLWFMPFDRLVSYRSIWGLLTLQLVSFILLVITGISYSAFLTGSVVCVAVFIICTMLIVNQSYILRTYDTSSDSAITPTARMYNMALVLMIIICVIVVGLGVGIIIIGLSVLGRLLLYTILGGFISSEVDSDTLIDTFDGAVFGEVGISPSTSVNKIIFAIFIFIMIVALVILIFGRGKGLIKRLVAFLVALYNRIVELLLDPVRGMSETRLDDDEYFKNRILITEQYYNAGTPARRRDLSYHDFTKAIVACKDDSERVMLAYATLVRHWRVMDYGIRVSDTPSEICEKLKAKTGIEDTNEITELFEQIKYAESNKASDKSVVLGKMCALVKKYRS